MMKVPPKLRTIFLQQKQENEALKERADDVVLGFKQRHWHYESRVKELESFALKVESGRVLNPAALEDFFACTLVVRNAHEIPVAEAEVRKHLKILERRPGEPKRTHKSPDSFPFDDLRLYVTLKPPELGRPTDLDGIRFEIQIKTFLQHAWSIATHELLYKSNDVRWSKARIAFQIKAMLEHAELAIEEATALSKGTFVAKTDERTAAIGNMIAAISDRWPNERLPSDLRRLAENIAIALKCFDARPEDLTTILDAESKEGRGAQALDLSPYAAVVQGLVFARAKELDKFLKRSSRRKLAVPEHIEVPAGVSWPPSGDNVVLL